MDNENIRLGGQVYCPNCKCYHSFAFSCEELQKMKEYNKEFFANLETTDTKQEILHLTLTQEEVDCLKNLLEKEISDLNQTQKLFSNLQLWLDKFNTAKGLLEKIDNGRK